MNGTETVVTLDSAVVGYVADIGYLNQG